MERLADSVKIGAVILASVFGVWGAMLLIGGTAVAKRHTYYYFVNFADASGVNKGMEIRAAGSAVGFVEGAPTYDHDSDTTMVKIRIDKKVPIYAASRLLISQDSVIGEKSLSLISPPKGTARIPVEPGTILQGENAADMQAMVKRADEIMENVNDLLGPDKLGGALTMLTGNVNTSLLRVDAIAQRVDKLLIENSAYMTATLKNVQVASGGFIALSSDLQATTAAMRQLATDPTNKQQLDAVLANMNRASLSMAEASEQAKALTGDPELQQNMRDTLRLSKETLEETKKTIQLMQGTLGGVDKLVGSTSNLVHGVNKKLGRKDDTETVTVTPVPGDAPGATVTLTPGTAPAPPAKPGSGSAQAGGGKEKTVELTGSLGVRAVDHNANGSADKHDRVVADARAAVGYDGRYVATGVDNIGEGGKINLLLGLGSPLRGGSARAGVYRGELGAGLAWYSGLAGMELTAYDPADPKFDAYGYIPAGESVDVIIGVEDAGGDPRVTAGAGVKF